MQILMLAWRNIWRNKRRTLITAASVFFAVFFFFFFRSMQIGSYANYTESIVEAYTGSIQIHQKGYWADKVLDHSMEYDDNMLKKLESMDNIRMVVPRIEAFALASFDQQTKGVAVTGIEPEVENNMTALKKKITRGNYLNSKDSGVLVAQKLADFLKIDLHDTLVLIGQGYHGQAAAEKFPVRGIVHFPSPELDGRLLYMEANTARNFFSLGNRLTSISIDLDRTDRMEETIRDLESVFHPTTYEVMPWNEMLPELVQTIKADNFSGIVFIVILYMIIAFGIVGTVMMMTVERLKEFGVMMVIGMQKKYLSMIVAAEMFLIGMIGILSGIIFSIPVIYYYHLHPWKLGGEFAKVTEKYGIEALVCFAFQPGFYVWQSLIVAGLVVLALIYPLRKVYKLEISLALK